MDVKTIRKGKKTMQTNNDLKRICRNLNAILYRLEDCSDLCGRVESEAPEFVYEVRLLKQAVEHRWSRNIAPYMRDLESDLGIEDRNPDDDSDWTDLPPTCEHCGNEGAHQHWCPSAKKTCPECGRWVNTTTGKGHGPECPERG